MSSQLWPQYSLLCCLLLGWLAPACAGFSPEQLEWLNSEAEHPALQVNEGELRFMVTGPEKPEHQQTMQITITNDTMHTGWAQVSQCHENLDQVDRLEIVFRQGKVRNLQVVEFKNIADARPQGHRVILRQVQPDSRICVQSESRIMQRSLEQGQRDVYEMTNGPFMRRFLDGFYPLNLSMQVDYPAQCLRLLEIQPEAQPGWQIRYDADRIFLKGRFEGKLITRFRFAPTR